jgi:hypothetical protein
MERDGGNDPLWVPDLFKTVLEKEKIGKRIEKKRKRSDIF